jgi:DNA-directed RNA polymerase subunit F
MTREEQIEKLLEENRNARQSKNRCYIEYLKKFSSLSKEKITIVEEVLDQVDLESIRR